MRDDMSRVIVERPRQGGFDRRGRPGRSMICPSMKACADRICSRGATELNENLSPLRRYLERQVGRPWNKVYAEIAAHLRADNAVQQHVRDHLRDFVAIKPRRRHGWYFTYPGDGKEPFSRLWYQPLYVDEKDGILKRTDRLPEEKARRAPVAIPLPGRSIAWHSPPTESSGASTASGTSCVLRRCPTRSTGLSSSTAKSRSSRFTGRAPWSSSKSPCAG